MSKAGDSQQKLTTSLGGDTTSHLHRLHSTLPASRGPGGPGARRGWLIASRSSAACPTQDSCPFGPECPRSHWFRPMPCSIEAAASRRPAVELGRTHLARDLLTCLPCLPAHLLFPDDQSVRLEPGAQGPRSAAPRQNVVSLARFQLFLVSRLYSVVHVYAASLEEAPSTTYLESTDVLTQGSRHNRASIASHATSVPLPRSSRPVTSTSAASVSVRRRHLLVPMVPTRLSATLAAGQYCPLRTDGSRPSKQQYTLSAK